MRMPVLFLARVKLIFAAVLPFMITSDCLGQEQQLEPRWTAQLPKWHYLIGFTPDGKTLVTGAESTRYEWINRIHVWDIASGKEMRSFAIDEAKVKLPAQRDATVISFSPDSKALKICNRVTGTHQWYSLTTGQLLVSFSFPSRKEGAVSFELCYRGQVFCLRIGMDDASDLFIWNWASKRLILVSTDVDHFDISPDGHYLVTIPHVPDSDPSRKIKPRKVTPQAQEKAIRVWDINSGQQLAKFPWERGSSPRLHFLPDSSTILIDHKLIDAKNWQERATIPNRGLQSLSPDGFEMLSWHSLPAGGTTAGIYNYRFSVCDLKTGRERANIMVYKYSSAFHGDGPVFVPHSNIVIAPVYTGLESPQEDRVLPRGSHLLFFDTTTGKEIASVRHWWSMDYLCAPNGKSLAFIAYRIDSNTGLLKLYDMPPGK